MILLVSLRSGFIENNGGLICVGKVVVGFDAKARKFENVDRHKEDEDVKISRALMRDEDGVFGASLSGPKGLFDEIVPGRTYKIVVEEVQSGLGDHE